MADSPVSRFAYRAFISYSHADQAWAAWLHRALETWRVPARLVGTTTARGVLPRRLTPIFRDREELASATDLGQAITAALAQSANLIVICSPAAAASRWVNEEVLAYQRMGGAGRIFCLIVAGEPNASEVPGRAADECFCPALRFKPGTANQPGGERCEPVAADARAHQDGRHNAKLKLIAGMLGVGFDALKQRDLHRRMQRMAAVTALALVTMALTALLAVAALVSRNDALQARAAAERHQKQAEDLVGFMLGDLNEKLDQMRRLDLIQSVNDKAMAYFAAMPSTDIGDTTLAQRAKALEQIGTVRMDLGNLPGALDAFQASARISAQLAAGAPQDAQRQVAYARTLAFIGLAHWRQNRLDDAQQNFASMRPALQRLAAQAPVEPQVLLQLELLDNNLGHVLEVRGQPDAAAGHYRERLRLAQQLTALQPGNRDYAAILGSAHGDLGRLALQRGDLLTAIAEYRADDAIEAHLAQADPNDNLQRQNLLESRAILGRTLALAGEDAAGAARLAEAVGMAAELARFEPGNTDFKLDLALYSSQLARLRRLGGDLPAATRLSQAAAGIFDSLVRQDPNNTEWRRHAAEAAVERAAQAHAAGRREAARSLAQTALQALSPLQAARPGDRDVLLLATAARLQLAATEADPAAARAFAQQALAATTVRNDAGDVRLLALKVKALLRLEQPAAAQPVLAQLWRAGGRDGDLLATLAQAGIAYPPNPEFQTRLAAQLQTTAGAAASDEQSPGIAACNLRGASEAPAYTVNARCAEPLNLQRSIP